MLDGEPNTRSYSGCHSCHPVVIVAAITSMFSDLMPYLACWRAAKILHINLLDNVLKTPLQFFERTPIGRILARFSKDVDVLDTLLPMQTADVVYCTFEVTRQLLYWYIKMNCTYSSWKKLVYLINSVTFILPVPSIVCVFRGF